MLTPLASTTAMSENICAPVTKALKETALAIATLLVLFSYIKIFLQ
jgi:hypothetical protein